MGSAGLESRYCQSCVPPGDSGRKSSSFYHLLEATIGLPRWLSGKEPGSQCRRHGCDPWIRKIPWRRKWQPTPVFLAWRIPWTEKPGGLQSIGSQRVRHNWVTEYACIGYQVRWGSPSHFESLHILISTQSKLVSGTKYMLFTPSPLTLILHSGHLDYSHPHPTLPSTTCFILFSFKIFYVNLF